MSADLFAECDKYNEEKNYEKMFEIMSPYKDSEDPNLAWRYARAKYRGEKSFLLLLPTTTVISFDLNNSK